MICLIRDNAIVYGPAPWDLHGVLEPLIIAGFDLIEGVLYRRDDLGDLLRVCDFPDAPPGGALHLGTVSILPVVDVAEDALAGKVQSGTLLAINGDVVESRPNWVDAPPPPTVAEMFTAKQAEIKAGADAILLPLVAEYPESEVRSWEQQTAEATAYQADPNAGATLIRGMALGRGVEVSYLAERILYHAAEWKVVSGPVIGQRQGLQKRLEEAVAMEDEAAARAAIQAIVVTYTLPQG